ncbi:proteasome subunit beta [Halobacteriales archaeon QS_5_70_15]|nr:MAG: proteasome subunit beta [Halobacteriales archaeon QS_5_70_15]
MIGQHDLPAEEGSAGEVPTYSTGTTTVGIVASDGVVLATDRRASLGGRFVSNKRTVKVEQVHPTAAITIAGSVGGAQAYTRQLRAQARLYETRRGEPMGMDALATAAGNALRGLPVSPLLGGADADGPRLFQLDAGGVLEDEYGATGSGTQVAVGAIEGRYDPDADVEATSRLAADAVAAASERDTASGNGLVLARITTDGVDLREHDTADAVASAAAGDREVTN